MRISAMLLLVAFGVAAAFWAGRPAYARTPTPTTTPTASPTPNATPTRAAVAAFHAYLWVDARRSWQDSVVPKIGDKVCGQDTLMPVTENGSYHEVEVVSDSVMPGCGIPGATVTFWVNGRQANQTAQWLPGQEQRLALVVGAPFAQFGGTMNLEVPGDGTEDIVPFINGRECGYTDRGFFSWDVYAVVVYADEFRPGCGVDGSEVTMKLVNLTTGEVRAIAAERGVWHAVGVEERLDLTLIPAGEVALGNVGTGGSQESGAAMWRALSLALAGIGLGAVAAGAALRRRLTAR